MNPQELAEEIIRRFGPMDRASHLLGIRLLEVRPGHVRMSMRVIDTMVNAQQICHGGLIFTLADEVGHLGRTRVYDVRATNQDQALIALFRGKSTAVKGAWVE